MGICYLCDTTGADRVDHLIALADGGSNDLTNLASCHSNRHDRKHSDPDWAR